MGFPTWFHPQLQIYKYIYSAWNIWTLEKNGFVDDDDEQAVFGKMCEAGLGIAWFEAGMNIEHEFVEGFNLGQDILHVKP